MYQRLIIAGNLGGEPEMRYTGGGQPVCNFSVATNRVWTTKSGEKGEETVWFRVSAWGKTAESANRYLHKGSKVLVEGRLVPGDNGNPRIWHTGQGEPAASFEVNADVVRFLTWDNESSGPGPAQSHDDFDIPF